MKLLSCFLAVMAYFKLFYAILRHSPPGGLWLRITDLNEWKQRFHFQRLLWIPTWERLCQVNVSFWDVAHTKMYHIQLTLVISIVTFQDVQNSLYWAVNITLKKKTSQSHQMYK